MAHDAVAEAVNADRRVTDEDDEVLLRPLHPRPHRHPHRARDRKIEGRGEEERDRQAEADRDPLRGQGPGN